MEGGIDRGEGLTRRDAGNGLSVTRRLAIPGTVVAGGLGIAVAPAVVHSVVQALPTPALDGALFATLAGTAVAGTMVAGSSRSEKVGGAAWFTAIAATSGMAVAGGLLDHNTGWAVGGGILAGLGGALVTGVIASAMDEGGALRAGEALKAAWLRRVAIGPLVVGGMGAVATGVGLMHGSHVPLAVTETIMTVGLGAGLPAGIASAAITAQARPPRGPRPGASLAE